MSSVMNVRSCFNRSVVNCEASRKGLKPYVKPHLPFVTSSLGQHANTRIIAVDGYRVLYKYPPFEQNVHLRRTHVCTAQASSTAYPQDDANGIGRFFYALYKFSRPHTMLGTFISVCSISALAVQGVSNAALPATLSALLQALTSALLMNISIVGINQCFDVEVDKVNKPYLPLASGELSMQAGVAICVTTALVALGIGFLSQSAPLIATLAISLGLGIVYSVELPFLRWKRNPLLAACCILAIRAVAVQLGFYFHMQESLTAAGAALSAGAGLQLTPAITFTVSFMLLFSIVIAFFKDIPDAKGDRGAGIRTLTVRLGVEKVFWTCIWILTAAYAGAAAYSVLAAHFAAAGTASSSIPLITAVGEFFRGAATTGAASSAAASPTATALSGAAVPASLTVLGSSGGVLGLRTLACVAGHALLCGLLWQRALKTDLNSTEDIASCYMHVWKLFYAEYILIPLLI